jgi:hypothetical protein
MLDAIEVYPRQGKIAPQAMRDLYIATIPLPPSAGMAARLAHVGTEAKLTIPMLEDLPEARRDHVGGTRTARPAIQPHDEGSDSRRGEEITFSI